MSRSLSTFFIFALCLSLLYSEQQSELLRETLDKANKLGLSNHPTWLRLLHYKKSLGKSEVLSPDFFISPNGSLDPHAELKATLTSFIDSPDKKHQCLFPARYYWLNHNLNFGSFDDDTFPCSKLIKWSKQNNAQSLSLFLVSGYFGNPASTFGHALLKINTDQKSSIDNMFDTVISFGATVPENENPLIYIVKGLSGGYLSGFTDKYYYVKDLVYSKNEYRDIWDYELNLTDFERNLIILHAWEIIGKKFQYYFLRENCSYRLAELIELGTNKTLIDDNDSWYAPIHLFLKLESIHRKRILNNQPGLFKPPIYIPSSRKKLYEHFKQLSPEELKVSNNIILHGYDPHQKEFNSLTDTSKMNTLDSVLVYHQHKIIESKPDKNLTLERSKNHILLKRLQYPSRKKNNHRPELLKSPAKLNPPAEISFGFMSDHNHKNLTTLSYSPYSQGQLGNNSLDRGELIIGKTTLSSDLHDELNIEKINLIQVRKLDVTPISIGNEKHWSWNLNISSERERNTRKYNTYGKFSFGQAIQLNPNIILTGMLGASVNRRFPEFRLHPSLESLWTYKKSSFKAQLELTNTVDYKKLKPTTKIDWQYNQSTQSAFKLSYNSHKNNQFSFNYIIFR